MNSILQKVKAVFLGHSVWMHVTIVLALSYIIMHMSQQVGGIFFFGWFAAMSIFSLPIYVFVILREQFWTGQGRTYWLIWSVMFIIYPLVLFLIKVDVNSLELSNLYNLDVDGTYIFTMLSFLFIGLEALLLFSKIRGSNKKSYNWIREVNGFKLATIAVGFLSLFLVLSSNDVQSNLEDKSWLSYGFRFGSIYFQFFIVYLSYYIYYYIHHHFLYRVLLKEKGIIPYFLGLGMVILLVSPIHNFLISFIPVINELKMHPMGLVPSIFDDINYSLPILSLALSFPLIVTIEWYRQANTLAELEQAKAKAELNLLRQQINPHFFFNTLNNLYAMSLTQEEETPDTILQLSELMRYVIYKGKEDQVDISDEVKYIDDYIDLQMIRIHKKVDLKMDINIENKQLKIPPLLFIILIENAFKHGIEPSGRNSTLHISLEEKGGVLTFKILNSLEPSYVQTVSGIGLDNLKKRLDILYSERHDLNIQKTDLEYRVTLKIQL